MLERTAERISVDLAERTSRRSFMGRLGMGIVALTGGSFVAAALDPSLAEAHHICGHTGTTGSCSHPFRPASRIDRYGYPVHPRYGYKVDDYGRKYTSSRQPRHKICEERVYNRHGVRATYGGGWSRCCFGRVRRIFDCCAYVRYRINGDRAVTGYCHGGRKVFCIVYRHTGVDC